MASSVIRALAVVESSTFRSLACDGARYVFPHAMPWSLPPEALQELSKPFTCGRLKPLSQPCLLSRNRCQALGQLTVIGQVQPGGQGQHMDEGQLVKRQRATRNRLREVVDRVHFVIQVH